MDPAPLPLPWPLPGEVGASLAPLAFLMQNSRTSAKDRLQQMLCSEPRFAALELLDHPDGFAVRRAGESAGMGELVATVRDEGVDWSYRCGQAGFGFGVMGSTLETPLEVVELRERLKELAETGRVTR